MKPFEIPYNFDKQLIDFLYIYQPNIHNIYLPPYQNDYISAKHYYIHENNINMLNTYPSNWENYISHINYINTKFNNKIMLLLQNKNILLLNNDLQKYLDLGITQFCVGSIQQAQVLKNISSSFEITGSITMKVEPNELQDNIEYQKYFNNFVLWFPYNKNINKIQQLPPWFKYILLINCFCSNRCDGTHHWFATKEQEQGQQLKWCPKINNLPPKAAYKMNIFVRPNDLYLFDNYISYYKLQGREYTTKDIINDIVFYSKDYNYYLINDSINIKDTFY